MNPVAFLYRTIHPVYVLWCFFRRPSIQASASIVERKDHILLIRRTYGRRDLWYLPGGLRNLHEDAGAAAVRETLEETGVVLHGAKFVTTLKFDDYYKHVTLHIYRGRAVGGLRIDHHEIAEAGWFSPHNLPATHESTRLALAHVTHKESER